MRLSSIGSWIDVDIGTALVWLITNSLFISIYEGI